MDLGSGSGSLKVGVVEEKTHTIEVVAHMEAEPEAVAEPGTHEDIQSAMQPPVESADGTIAAESVDSSGASAKDEETAMHNTDSLMPARNDGDHFSATTHTALSSSSSSPPTASLHPPQSMSAPQSSDPVPVSTSSAGSSTASSSVTTAVQVNAEAVGGSAEGGNSAQPRIAQSGLGWDVVAWQRQLKQALDSTDTDRIRTAYQSLLDQFPTSARHWIAWLEWELSRAQTQRVQTLFTKCLRSVLHLDLWKLYLTYVKHTNSPVSGLQTRTVLVQAYEFVLSHVGLDLYSTSIWMEYLDFIKSWEVHSPFDEGQRMDALRKTFHRAICIPLDQIEQIWRDYDAFENHINRLTAKKIISEKGPAYMTARAAVRDLKSIHEPLAKFVMSVPPLWKESEYRQLAAWKRWIEWEKRNPLHYDDKPSVLARVMYAYRQALSCCRYYPEIWRDAVAYLLQEGQIQDGLAMLHEALECCPDSALLRFFAAELAEQNKDLTRASQHYEEFIEVMQSKIQALQPIVDDLSIAVERAAAMSHRSGQGDTQQQANAPPAEDSQDSVLEAAAKRMELAGKRSELQTMMDKANLAWIMFMKFCRRTDGIKSSRQVFSRSRKTNYCNSQIFIASALMEYYWNKDKQVAFKIFEVGLKSYGDDLAYVSTYLDHLIAVNDDSNARALFERSLGIIQGPASFSLWRKFLEYEQNYGDLATVLNVEKRLAEAFDLEPHSSRQLAERYAYGNLNVIARVELGLAEREPATLGSLPERSDTQMALTRPSNADADLVMKGNAEEENYVLPATKEEEAQYPARPKALSTEPPSDQTARKERTIPPPSAAEIAARQARTPAAPTPSQEPITAAQPPVQPTAANPFLVAGNVVPMMPVGAIPVPAVPNSLTSFLASLPAKQTFTGPIVPADVVIRYIMQIPGHVPQDADLDGRRDYGGEGNASRRPRSGYEDYGGGGNLARDDYGGSGREDYGRDADFGGRERDYHRGPSRRDYPRGPPPSSRPKKPRWD